MPLGGAETVMGTWAGIVSNRSYGGSVGIGITRATDWLLPDAAGRSGGSGAATRAAALEGWCAGVMSWVMDIPFLGDRVRRDAGVGNRGRA